VPGLLGARRGLGPRRRAHERPARRRPLRGQRPEGVVVIRAPPLGVHSLTVPVNGVTASPDRRNPSPRAEIVSPACRQPWRQLPFSVHVLMASQRPRPDDAADRRHVVACVARSRIGTGKTHCLWGVSPCVLSVTPGSMASWRQCVGPFGFGAGKHPARRQDPRQWSPLRRRTSRFAGSATRAGTGQQAHSGPKRTRRIGYPTIRSTGTGQGSSSVGTTNSPFSRPHP
jgi:hypothetical protein